MTEPDLRVTQCNPIPLTPRPSNVKIRNEGEYSRKKGNQTQEPEAVKSRALKEKSGSSELQKKARTKKGNAGKWREHSTIYSYF